MLLRGAGLRVTGRRGGVRFGLGSALGRGLWLTAAEGVAEGVGKAFGPSLGVAHGVDTVLSAAAGRVAADEAGAADPAHPCDRRSAEQAAAMMSDRRGVMRTRLTVQRSMAAEPADKYRL